MASFANLLHASNELTLSRHVRPSDPVSDAPTDTGNVSQEGCTNILIPLAALAFQSANSITGLSECLKRHGWNGQAFERPIDLSRFTADLWAIYDTIDKSSLLDKSQYAIKWDSTRPLQSLRDQLKVLSANSRFIPPGSLLNSLTYYVMIAIIETDKLGLSSERLKRRLAACGWSTSKYAFDELPDFRRLEESLSDSGERQEGLRSIDLA